MGYLLSLLRAVPALERILKQVGKLFRNAKADNHVAHAKRDLDVAIKRVRKSKASKRKPPN